MGKRIIQSNYPTFTLDNCNQACVYTHVLRLETTSACPPVVPDFIGLALTPYTLNVSHTRCMGFFDGLRVITPERMGVLSGMGLGVGFVVCNDDSAPE
jgi:hypothetical protein